MCLDKAIVVERFKKNTIYLSGNLLSACKNTVFYCVEESCRNKKRRIDARFPSPRVKRQLKKLVDQILSTFLTLRFYNFFLQG